MASGDLASRASQPLPFQEQHITFLYRTFWYCMHNAQWEPAASVFRTILKASPLDDVHFAKNAAAQSDARYAASHVLLLRCTHREILDCDNVRG